MGAAFGLMTWEQLLCFSWEILRYVRDVHIILREYSSCCGIQPTRLKRSLDPDELEPEAAAVAL